MARIVIDHVDCFDDLLTALAVVHRVFAASPEKFASVEERFSKGVSDNCACPECTSDPDAELERHLHAVLPSNWDLWSGLGDIEGWAR